MGYLRLMIVVCFLSACGAPMEPQLPQHDLREDMGQMPSVDLSNISPDLVEAQLPDLVQSPPDLYMPLPDLLILCGGIVCSFPNAGSLCYMDQCIIGQCAAGYGNCNGLTMDGCEAAFAGDIRHCGGCNMPCSGRNMSVSGCVTGSCIGICDVGFADCNGDMRKDGCEINLNTDAKNCGACGMACPVGNQCVDGVCTKCGTPGDKCCTPAGMDWTCNAGSICVGDGNPYCGKQKPLFCVSNMMFCGHVGGLGCPAIINGANGLACEEYAVIDQNNRCNFPKGGCI